MKPTGKLLYLFTKRTAHRVNNRSSTQLNSKQWTKAFGILHIYCWSYAYKCITAIIEQPNSFCRAFCWWFWCLCVYMNMYLLYIPIKINYLPNRLVHKPHIKKKYGHCSHFILLFWVFLVDTDHNNLIIQSWFVPCLRPRHNLECLWSPQCTGNHS